MIATSKMAIHLMTFTGSDVEKAETHCSKTFALVEIEFPILPYGVLDEGAPKVGAVSPRYDTRHPVSANAAPTK